MPRAPEFSKKFLLEKLKDETIFDEKGNLLPQGDPIWTRLRNDLQLTMLPKSLHLYLYTDVNNSRSELEVIQGIKSSTLIVKDGCKSGSKPSEGRSCKRKRKKSVDISYHNYPLNNELKRPPLNFTISFTESEWSEMKPHDSKRNKTLQKGWADKIYRKCFEAEGIRCALSFDYLSVTGDNKEFSIMFGACCTEKKCKKTSLFGELRKNDSSENDGSNYTFGIQTFDVRDIVHKKKRKFANVNKEKGQELLINQTAVNYREGMQKELKKNCSYEPADLHSSDLYDKHRQKIRNSIIGYDKSMTLTQPRVIERCGIVTFCAAPFYIFYWKEDQITFWNKVRDSKPTLSFDATGGMIKVQVLEGVKCPTLLYYELVVGVGRKIVPVMQFISSIHHTSVVQDALETWILKGKALIPKLISTDGSPVLQNAVSLVFNKMTFHQYNVVCYDCLIGEQTTLPHCFYKSDRAHILSAMNHWLCMKAATAEVLNFYKRLIAYASKLTSVDEIRKIAVAIFTVSQSSKMSDNIQWRKKLDLLCGIIKTHTLPEDNVKKEITESEDEKTFEEMPATDVDNLTIFIKGIISEADDLVDNESKKPNVYYCANSKKNFESLFQKFLSWTNVMAKAFGCDGEEVNSARSETDFRLVKAKIPRRVNIIKFMLYNISKIESLVNRDFTVMEE